METIIQALETAHPVLKLVHSEQSRELSRDIEGVIRDNKNGTSEGVQERILRVAYLTSTYLTDEKLPEGVSAVQQLNAAIAKEKEKL